MRIMTYGALILFAGVIACSPPETQTSEPAAQNENAATGASASEVAQATGDEVSATPVADGRLQDGEYRLTIAPQGWDGEVVEQSFCVESVSVNRMIEWMSAFPPSSLSCIDVRNATADGRIASQAHCGGGGVLGNTSFVGAYTSSTINFDVAQPSTRFALNRLGGCPAGQGALVSDY